jgi:hypothetical protein
MLSRRNEEIVDFAAGAEGDVLACGTGLKWLQPGQFEQLTLRLEELNRPWSQLMLRVLATLPRGPREHRELAHHLGYTAQQLQTANQQLSKLLHREFAGRGWPFGYERQGRDYVYEMHPEVGAMIASAS